MRRYHVKRHSYGHQQMQVAIDAINELADEAGVTAWDWVSPSRDAALAEKNRKSGRK